MVRNAVIFLLAILVLPPIGVRGADEDRGAYDKALANLNEVIRLHPHNGLALGLRAQLGGKMGNWDQVIADCTELLKQNPDSLKYLALRSQAYYEKADFEHALADANDFLRRMKPGDAEDYRLRGELHRLRAAAAELWSLRRFREDPASLIKETLKGYDSGPPPDPRAPIEADRKQAWTDYAQSLQLDPAHVETYRSRAQVYFEQKEFDRGIADLTAVVRLRPSDRQAYCDRAEAYYECGQQAHRNRYHHDISLDKHEDEYYRRAVADYSEALRLQPGDADVHRGRAKVYLSSRDYEKAIADCTEVLRRRPDDWEAYQIRTIAYRNIEDYDRAIADCTEMIRLSSRDPKRPNWIGMRAQLYEAKGEIEHALADYTEGIRLDPGKSFPYLARAEFFLRRREFERALADYAEAIEIEKKTENSVCWVGELHGRRAWVCLWKKDFDAAVREYTKAIEYNDEEGDLYAWRALVHVLRGERDPALVDCKTAAERYEIRRSRRALRAALLVLQGEFRQAIAEFRPRSERFQGMRGMGGYGIPRPAPQDHDPSLAPGMPSPIPQSLPPPLAPLPTPSSPRQ